MELVNKEDLKFKLAKIVKISDEGHFKDHKWKYELALPDFLADWDVWDYWEKERLFSMEANLKKGDVVFDVGAEQGAISALIAQWVGGENMVLFEPTEEFWPGIKMIWEANGLETPRGVFVGLVAEAESQDADRQLEQDEPHWPAQAESDRVCVRRSYKYLHDDSGKESPRVSVDYYFISRGVSPDAITIDVEGAELEVLKGAKALLELFHPLVWVSIHPDLALRDYGVKREDVLDFMYSLGYNSKHLGTDHEEHWAFWHPKGRELK